MQIGIVSWRRAGGKLNAGGQVELRLGSRGLWGRSIWTGANLGMSSRTHLLLEFIDK